MHRFLLLATATVAASACTTSEPSTDTGRLIGLDDQVFECQEAAGGTFTCMIDVSVTDAQLTAIGRFENGSTGPMATATINESARLRIAEMIGHLPLESPDVVHDVGCGGAPLRSTNAHLLFDHDGERNFQFEYAAEGPMADFSRYLQDLVTGIRTCNSPDLAFDSCTPNVF